MLYNDELIEILALENTKEYNLLKCAEEISELNEVILKYVTKDPDYKPDLSRLAEELSHVIIRSTILAISLDLEDQVSEAYVNKMDELKIMYNEKRHSNI